jgi:kumamolisin
MAAPRRLPLPGSERHALTGAREVGPSDRAELLDVSLHLRPRAPLPALDDVGQVAPLTREQFAARHGAAPNDVARVAAFAGDHDLRVTAVHEARCTVVLSGSVAALGRAFDVELQRWERDGTTWRGRVGPVHVPADLAGVIEGVFGLDDRPQAQSRVRRAAAHAHAASRTAFTPPQVAALYDFPRHLDGAGQTVALLQLGGGYSRERDLDPYFAALGLATPEVLDVSVDHGRNLRSGSPDSDDSEVQLDLAVLGGVVPGARIALYFAPNTERGFLDGVSAAVHDGRLQPSLLSISWGAAEPTWTLQAIRAIDSVFQAAASLGITVCVAAGDSGSGDDVHDRRPHVDFPASSPYALACGGTRLHLRRDRRALASEEVWHGGGGAGSTGGGISEVFACPPWQRECEGGGPPSSGDRHGRGLPDVAAAADPQTGYLVHIDGQLQVLGGTSAVAPLWAALVAMANQRRGRPVGLLAPLLYSALCRRGALRDVTKGRNGAYQARRGWDPCTGLGSPNGERLVELLAG